MPDGTYECRLWDSWSTLTSHPLQLHVNQEHPDAPLLEHTRELIAKLESLGIQPSPEKDGDDEEEEGWEDVEGSDDDGDVEMS